MDTVKIKRKEKAETSAEKYTIYSVEQAYQHLTELRSEAEQQLYIVTEDVLCNIWDALCLSINQQYRDEYLPYLPHVFDLLKVTENGKDIREYLLFIEEKLIGTLPGDTLPARRAAHTVDILLKQRDTILKKDQEP